MLTSALGSPRPVPSSPAVAFGALPPPLLGRRRIARAAACLAWCVVALDAALWGGVPGAGLSVGLLLGMAGLSWMRPRALPRLPAAMLVATAVQSYMDPGVANLVMAAFLVAVLAAVTALPGLPPEDAVLTLLTQFGHPLRHVGGAGRLVRRALGPVLGWQRIRHAGSALLWPAAMTAVFLLLLGQGNAVMAAQIQRAWQLAASVFSPDGSDLYSPLRWVFWLVAAAVAHAALRPRDPAAFSRTRAARWLARTPPDQAQARLTLLGANVAFAWANVVDAVHLWLRCQVPAGVSRSEFVHDGVNSLALAVCIAAVLLGVLFRRRVTDRVLRGLGLGFVVQNLVLVASVAQRDALYIQADGPTSRRIHVLIFLALVAVGYLLLWRYVARGRPLGWLLRANAVAAVVTLFAVQFVDTDGYVARHHVERILRTGQPRTDRLFHDLGVRGLEARVVMGDPGAERALAAAEAAMLEDGWRGWSRRRAGALEDAAAALARH